MELFRNDKPQAWHLLCAIVERKHCGNRCRVPMTVEWAVDDDQCSSVCSPNGTENIKVEIENVNRIHII